MLSYALFIQVSMPHPVKGECVYCFVSLKNVSIRSDIFIKNQETD